MMHMYRINGEIIGYSFSDGLCDVGVFNGPRIDSDPVAWQRTRDGTFSFSLPKGEYYLHALCGAVQETAFFDVHAWGSYGGLYGFRSPICVEQDEGPLYITVTVEGRDLLDNPSHRQVPLNLVQSEWLRQVEQMAWENPWRSISEMATELSVNRIYLSATFKRGRGMTIEEYRTCVRVEIAKAMLASTNKSLIEVADHAGYESVSQLVRAFEQWVGVTPGQFRELAQEMSSVAELLPSAPNPGEAYVPARIGFRALLDRVTSTVSGTVHYDGVKRGRIIYVGAFRTPLPTSYPVGWASLPRPGDFTMRCFASGPIYVMACYCQSPMRYPGDMRTAFADGVYIQSSSTTDYEPEASILHAKRGKGLNLLRSN